MMKRIELFLQSDVFISVDVLCADTDSYETVEERGLEMLEAAILRWKEYKKKEKKK